MAVATLLLCLGAPALTEDRPRRLCFFSLNNDREFELTRSFLADAARTGGRAVVVEEYQRPEIEADPEQSFRAMAASGDVCDGLVISGHHTGSFSGIRADGDLSISALEALSCAPAYRGFFRRVNAVWLQGCRTLGAEPRDETPGVAGEFSADYHMQRVGAELMRSSVRQSFAELSFQFSSTLDRDNPLATRYQRVFPAATVFGWTRSSPGFKAKSEKSLVYHMAHMTHLAQGVDPFDPTRSVSVANKRHMSASLDDLLAGLSEPRRLAVDAWVSHGNVKRRGLGYDNPDLRAYTPLLASGENRLLATANLGCALRNATGAEEAARKLEQILDNPYYLAHNLNAVWEIYQDYQRFRPVDAEILRAQLVQSESMMELLRDKLSSNRTGLLMKVEYYSFFRALTGDRDEAYEQRILANARYFMLASDLAGSSYDVRDFREALLTSLDKHDLGTTAFYDDIVRSPDVTPAALYALAWTFRKLSQSEVRGLIDEIARHPNSDQNTLRVVAIWLLENGVDPRFQTLRAVVGHPAADAATLGTAASVLARHDVRGGSEVIAAIVAHDALNGLALGQASLAVRRSGRVPGDAVMRQMILHPAIDQQGLRNLAAVLARQHDDADDDELLEAIRRHPLADAMTLHRVDAALRAGQGASGS